MVADVPQGFDHYVSIELADFQQLQLLNMLSFQACGVCCRCYGRGVVGCDA